MHRCLVNLNCSQNCLDVDCGSAVEVEKSFPPHCPKKACPSHCSEASLRRFPAAACNNGTNNQLFAPAGGRRAPGEPRGARPGRRLCLRALLRRLHLLGLLWCWRWFRAGPLLLLPWLLLLRPRRAGQGLRCWPRLRNQSRHGQLSPWARKDVWGVALATNPTRLPVGSVKSKRTWAMRSTTWHCRHLLQHRMLARDPGVASQARPFGLPFPRRSVPHGGPRHQPGWQYDPRIFRLGPGAVNQSEVVATQGYNSGGCGWLSWDLH